MIFKNYYRATSSRSGFSLVELLVSISILTLILGVLVSLFVATSKIAADAKNVHDVNTEAVWAMSVISNAIRNGKTLTSPTIGAQGTSLTVATQTGSSIAIDLSGGLLRIASGGGGAIALTSARTTASALTFQNLSRANTPGTIRYQFTLTSGGTVPYQKTFIGSASVHIPLAP